MGLFSGKVGLVMGVANDRSIAWSMSESLAAEGAELAFTYLPGERSERRVRQLVEPMGAKLIQSCDVQKDEDIVAVFARAKDVYGKLDFVIHSIAFAPTAELKGSYIDVTRAGWHMAMDISAYSLVITCREAAKLMPDGGSIVTLTYFGGEKVMPGYNLMGVCKAALEHSVRYLAWDLGRKKIRVNAISAGPMRTLSSAGIAEFDEMREHQAKKSCLGRNVDPKELGDTGLYLLSDLSSAVTGETIHVDCGFSIVGL
jgi:enoyl-[acyl-carrier protein] reductase I